MAMKFQDYYEILGVARTATADEIRQSFRKLARIHHPDVAKDKVAGEAKFKELNEAYEVLGDPEKRRRYDELGENWRDTGAGQAPGPQPSGGARSQAGSRGFEYDGTGFSDFFESFFAGGRDGYGSAHAYEGHGGAFTRPGRDVEADILVTLEEALRGSAREVTLRRPGEPGHPPRSDTYRVRIPAGVREGQRIRLAGQGDSGSGGGSPGDLYLRVRLALHPDFRVEGGDLHTDLDLAPWEAVLGVRARIRTLDGVTTLGVPPGTSAGARLRLRGLGLPLAGGARGDLYATVRILTPDKVSEEERKLWEKLAATSAFKPRTTP